MPFYRLGNKYFNILPANSDKFFSMGINDKEIFYVKDDGDTPFGSPSGNTFLSLIDTPTNIDKNVNGLLGSVGDRIDFITDTSLKTLKVEDKLCVKDVEIDGTLLMKGVLKADTKIVSRQFVADDIIKTKHLQAENTKIDVLECERINGEYLKLNKLEVNSIDVKQLNVESFKIVGDCVGSINEPVIISKAEVNKFNTNLKCLDIYFTYPFNKPCVEFTVETDCLLQDKIVDCIVNQVYGDEEIMLMSKMISITEPNKFKTVLNLGVHKGNVVMKMRLSIS